MPRSLSTYLPRFAATCLLAFLLTGQASLGHAQTAPARTAVMRPTVAGPALDALGAAVGRVVRARAGELEVVASADTPAATFADLQLAVGCLSETMECFRAVAGQLAADGLLLTTLDEVQGATVVTIAFVDVRGEGRSSRVVRTIGGTDRDNQVLSAIEGMLYELFGLEPPAELEPVETPDPIEDPDGVVDPNGSGEPDPVVAPERSFPTATVLVGAVALVALAVGVGMGVASSSTEDEFAAAPTGTPLEVDAALELQSQGERQATTANVLFVVGGVAAATSLLLYFLVDRDSGQPEVAASVDVGPQHAALTLSGHFGGAQ